MSDALDLWQDQGLLRMAPRMYWLDARGSRVPITAGSVLVGRSPDCDVVLSDTQISRHHALFRLTEEGAEVVALGRLPVLHNGTSCAERSPLEDGDRIELGTHAFTVRTGPGEDSHGAAMHWFIERHAGALLRVASPVFHIGGSASDHLMIPAWAPATLALLRIGEGLVLETLHADVFCERALPVGELVTLQSGARIQHRGEQFRVIALPSDPSQATDLPAGVELPIGAHLQFLPRGGRLTLEFSTRTRAVYFADRRCDLIACLLQPPSPFVPGEIIPDEVVSERVWTDRTSGRVEINTLLYRARKDMLKADLDGVALLERAGGGVRLCLAPGAKVSVSTG